MKKRYMLLMLLLAAALLFAACAKNENTPSVAEPAQTAAPTTQPEGEPSSAEPASTAAVPALPENLTFPDWVHVEDCRRAYNYALYAASQQGYACDYNAELIAMSVADSLAYFGEDGCGFSLYAVFSGMQQREFLLVGTADYGQTWFAWPETIHVVTSLEEPVLCGDYALIRTTNLIPTGETVLVIKKDGTYVRQIESEDLIPEIEKPEENCYFTFTSISVLPDFSVAFDLAANSRHSEEIVDRFHKELPLDMLIHQQGSGA